MLAAAGRRAERRAANNRSVDKRASPAHWQSDRACCGYRLEKVANLFPIQAKTDATRPPSVLYRASSPAVLRRQTQADTADRAAAFQLLARAQNQIRQKSL